MNELVEFNRAFDEFQSIAAFRTYPVEELKINLELYRNGEKMIASEALADAVMQRMGQLLTLASVRARQKVRAKGQLVEARVNEVRGKVSDVEEGEGGV